MAFIEQVPLEDASGKLQELYEQDLEKNGYVANYTKVMSLRPEVVAAWRQLSGAIRGNMRLRRYELVTLAAAGALRCTY